MIPTPSTSLRPPFAVYLFERGIFLKDAARAVGCSTEYLRLINLPWSDPKRRNPSHRIRAAIADYTAGAVPVTSWTAPIGAVEAA